MAFRRLLWSHDLSGSLYIIFSNYQCFGKFQTKLMFSYSQDTCALPDNKKQTLFHDSGLTKVVPSISLCVSVLETANLFQYLADRKWPKDGFQPWL